VYGFKQNVDVSFLVGLVLEQVAIGQYQVQIGFDQDTRISVELSFKYSSAEGTFEWRQQPQSSKAAAAALNLLGASVIAATIADPKTLELEFSNGDRLQLLDVSEQYESLSITRPGWNLYV